MRVQAYRLLKKHGLVDGGTRRNVAAGRLNVGDLGAEGKRDRRKGKRQVKRTREELMELHREDAMERQT